MKLVVTVPAQNEEKTIARVVSEVPREALCQMRGITSVEVIVMDDQSTDATADEATRAGAIVVPIHGRPGLGKVFQTGIEAAMRLGADFVVNIDGDGQFNAGDIPALVEPLVAGRADFVTCSRFKNPDFHPTMPPVKFWGNWAVVKIVNSVCGGSRFTDVSCGFRAFNREALYRLTLFGKYTYTQECFIDLFSKGLRIEEIPLKVRGVREHGKSRVAKSVWKYGTNTLPIIIRAMRDIRPLKFFGVVGLILAIPGIFMLGLVTTHYLQTQRTQPYTSLITLGGGLVVLSFVMSVLALLADMMARHRRITEELLYLARMRIYGNAENKVPSTRPSPITLVRGRLAINGHVPAHAASNGKALANGFAHANAATTTTTTTTTTAHGENGMKHVRPSKVALGSPIYREAGVDSTDETHAEKHKQPALSK